MSVFYTHYASKLVDMGEDLKYLLARNILDFVHDFNLKFSNPYIGYPLILTPGLTPIISLVNEQRSLLGETGFTRCKKVEEKFQLAHVTCSYCHILI